MLLFLLAALTQLLLVPVQASRDTPDPPYMYPGFPCNCSDVDPRQDYRQRVQYNCLDQRSFGNCNQQFMFQTVVEVPEGYCQTTCGRCSCCRAVLPILKGQWPNVRLNGTYNSLLQLATAANVSQDLDNPGFEWTILAPSDEGLKNTLYDMGFPGGLEDFINRYGSAGALALLRAHIIPPEQYYVALSTPFMQNGYKFQVANGQTLTVQRPSYARAGDGSWRLQGINSVGIVSEDIPACKSNIIFIDKGIQIDTSQLASTSRVQAQAGAGGK